MKLNYKKQNLVESLGFNVNFKNHYGNKPQNVKITPEQFKRLMESYIVYEEKMHDELDEYSDSFQQELNQDILDEMNFGDDGGDNLPAGVNMDTENFNNPVDLDEYGYDFYDHTNRSDYDGRKSRVVGVYSNIDKQRTETNEDTMGQETYNYDENIGSDMGRLHHLERERSHAHGGHKSDLDQHIHRLIDDMKYDDKRGGLRYRREPGEHFYHEGNGFMAETKNMSIREKQNLLREAKRELRRRG